MGARPPCPTERRPHRCAPSLASSLPPSPDPRPHSYAVSESFLHLASAISTGGVFSFYAAIATIGGTWLYFYLPETNGVSFERMEVRPRRCGARP